MTEPQPRRVNEKLKRNWVGAQPSLFSQALLVVAAVREDPIQSMREGIVNRESVWKQSPGDGQLD